MGQRNGRIANLRNGLPGGRIVHFEVGFTFMKAAVNKRIGLQQAGVFELELMVHCFALGTAHVRFSRCSVCFKV